MEDRPRGSINLDNIDIQAGLRDALRLLASTSGENVKPHLNEVAILATELFDGIDVDPLDDEDLNALLDRFCQTLFGLTLAGHSALVLLAEHGVDRLEFMKFLEEIQEEDD